MSESDMMLELLKTTDEEKEKIYMKLTKKELVEMLIECNKAIDTLLPSIDYTTIKYTSATLKKKIEIASDSAITRGDTIVRGKQDYY